MPSGSVTILLQPRIYLLPVLYLSLGHRFISIIRFSIFAVSFPGPIPVQFLWDFWWTKWHWDKIFSKHFGLPLSVSFYLWCILIYHCTIGAVYMNLATTRTSLVKLNTKNSFRVISIRALVWAMCCLTFFGLNRRVYDICKDVSTVLPDLN